jgi:predicted nucleic acid-binding protein
VELVIDASMAMAWAFADERDAEAIAAGRYVVKNGGIVPALWLWEIQNVLRNAEKRGRVETYETSEILRALRAMPLLVDATASAVTFGSELSLARHHAFTVYDAAYLELAARRGTRLATKDRALQAAAKSVDLLWTSETLD